MNHHKQRRQTETGNTQDYRIQQSVENIRFPMNTSPCIRTELIYLSNVPNDFITRHTLGEQQQKTTIRHTILGSA